jgi:lysyl-tRNA synthetase class 2
MMELYEAYADYHSMMDLTEAMVVACVDVLGGGRKLVYDDKVLDFTPPWKRESYASLFKKYVKVAMSDAKGVRQRAKEAKLPLQVRDPKTNRRVTKEHDVLVHELFEHHVEHRLQGPVFVYDYPAALCPLTKRKARKPEIAERFELYVNCMELANAYTELNDPIMQEETFRRQLAGLSEEESMAKMDDDFIRALRHGMPPAGGLGVGVDRLTMLLTNTKTIRDVILFPLQRPEQT